MSEEDGTSDSVEMIVWSLQICIDAIYEWIQLDSVNKCSHGGSKKLKAKKSMSNSIGSMEWNRIFFAMHIVTENPISFIFAYCM